MLNSQEHCELSVHNDAFRGSGANFFVRLGLGASARLLGLDLKYVLGLDLGS